MAAKKRGVYDVNYVVTPKGVVAMGVPAQKAMQQLFDLNLRGVPAAVVRALYAPTDEKTHYFLLEHVMEFNPIGVHHPQLMPVLLRHQPARLYTSGGQYKFETVGSRSSKALPGPKRPKQKASPAPRPRPHQGLRNVEPARGVRSVGDVLAGIKKKKPIAPCQPDFTRGLKEAITQRALYELAPIDITRGMVRFRQCDWGEVNSAQTRENNRHTHSRRGPIRGSYRATLSGREFWIIASPLENALIVLLPEDN
jgi:hypothetical protein